MQINETTGNSVDCEQEYENAKKFSDDDLGHFCNRCRTEGGAQPLRCRCSYCHSECQAECTEGWHGGTTTIVDEEAECMELIEDIVESHAEIRDCIESPTCFEAKETYLINDIDAMGEAAAEMGCEEYVECDTLEEEYEDTTDALVVCVEANHDHCSEDNKRHLCQWLEEIDYGLHEKECAGAEAKPKYKVYCSRGMPQGGR